MLICDPVTRILRSGGIRTKKIKDDSSESFFFMFKLLIEDYLLWDLGDLCSCTVPAPIDGALEKEPLSINGRKN